MITHTPNPVNGHFFALQLSDLPYTNNLDLFLQETRQFAGILHCLSWLLVGRGLVGDLRPAGAPIPVITAPVNVGVAMGVVTGPGRL